MNETGEYRNELSPLRTEKKNNIHPRTEQSVKFEIARKKKERHLKKAGE